VLTTLAGHRSIATTQACIDVSDEMKKAVHERGPKLATMIVDV
jgi:site-specific recombinase XerD